MIILRRKSDNVVIMAHPGLAWADGVLTVGGMRAPNIREADHEILTVSSVPDDLQGGHYTYTEADGWVLTVAGETASANFLIAEIERIQAENKATCREHILNLYPEEKQRNAALGGYSAVVCTAIGYHIKRLRDEENRVFDLLEDATTLEGLYAIPAPDFEGVTYVEA